MNFAGPSNSRRWGMPAPALGRHFNGSRCIPSNALLSIRQGKFWAHCTKTRISASAMSVSRTSSKNELLSTRSLVLLAKTDILDLSQSHFALQTSSKLYLVLDFINGGHLFFQLYRQVLDLLPISQRCSYYKTTEHDSAGLEGCRSGICWLAADGLEGHRVTLPEFNRAGGLFLLHRLMETCQEEDIAVSLPCEGGKWNINLL